MNLRQYSSLVLAATFLVLTPSTANATRIDDTIELLDGAVMEYSVVLPDGYDGVSPLPAILVLPGGNQSRRWVDWGLKHYWQAEAETRGYLLISMTNPRDKLFYEGGHEVLPEFISRIKVHYRIKGGTFHLAGISNGGMSAFAAAAAHPESFTSVLALGGYVWAPTDEKYAALAGKCIAVVTGERDFAWTESARRDHARFSELGKETYLEVVPGSPVRDSAFADDRAGHLFDLIDNGAGC